LNESSEEGIWCTEAAGYAVYVQRVIKGDAQHIDKLHFAATRVSFVMDIVILIQCCRSTHLYSVCDRRLFVTVCVLCITCVMLCY
jgi:hypothetical protein